MNLLSRNPLLLRTTMIALPVLVFCVNQILVYVFGVKVISTNPIDKIFHVVGGLSISIFAAGILWHLIYRKIIGLKDPLVFHLLVFGVLCFTVISWEIWEYFFIFPILPETISYSDTVTDMICGLAGGVTSHIFIRRPIA